LDRFGKLVCAMSLAKSASVAQPLPSWQDGPARRAIIDAVDRLTRRASTQFVPPTERVAVFDNDGTLWPEQPAYVQAMFLLDRIKQLAPAHPDWHDREPYMSALAGNLHAVAAAGERALAELAMATHAGMTTDEFETIVKDWMASARHPHFDRPYVDVVYRPMLELMDWLRASAFKVYIVSGGGVEFIRPWAQSVYGVVPEQVIGSTIELRYELRDPKPVLRRLPQVDAIDDQEGKPVSIQKFIGRRPTMAFGNSDGDLAMLQWTMAGPGARFAALVHHTDGDREWAYDRESRFGRLDRALDEAKTRNWTLIDMKSDWKRVYAFEH
jgi:phosphoglycolate phosphatase-like HAD superfamily hydrolase